MSYTRGVPGLETTDAGLTGALRALADPTRRHLIEKLRQREECVSVLAEALGITTALASHHLQVLVGVGLVQERHRGSWRCYSLVSDRLEWLLEELGGLLDPVLPATAWSGTNPCGGVR